MTMEEPSNPVTTCKGILSWLSFFGCIPFSVKFDTSKSKIVIHDKKFVFILLNVVLPEIMTIIGFAIFVTDRETWYEYIDIMFIRHNISRFTVAAGLSFVAITLQVNVMIAIVMARKVKCIRDLNQVISEQLCHIPGIEFRTGRFVKFLSFKTLLLLSHLAVILTWNLTVTMQNGGNLLMAIIMSFSFFLGFLPVSSASVEFVVKVHVDFIHDNFTHLRDELKLKFGSKTVIECGIQLTQLLKEFESCFGSLILLQCGLCFANEVLFLYFLLMSYNLVFNISTSLFLYGSACGILNIYNTWQKVNYFNMGEGMCNIMKECLIQLQRKRHGGSFDDVQPYSLDLMERRLSEKSPLKPCNAFQLTYEALSVGIYGYALLIGLILLVVCGLLLYALAEKENVQIPAIGLKHEALHKYELTCRKCQVMKQFLAEISANVAKSDNMESHHRSLLSETFTILNWLSRLYFIPFELTRETDGRLKITEKKQGFLLLNVMLPEILAITGIVILFVNPSAWEKALEAVFLSYGVARFTVMTGMLFLFLALQVNVLVAFVFTRKIELIAKLNDDMFEDLNSHQKHKLTTKSYSRYLILKAVVMLTYMFVAISWGGLFSATKGDSLAMGLLMGTLYFVGFMPISSAVVEFIFKIHIDNLIQRFDALQEDLKTATKHMERIIDNGIRLTDYLNDYEKCFGVLSLLQCGLCFGNEIAFVYFVLSSYSLLSNISLGLVYYGTACLLLNIYNSWQKLNYFSLGQKLAHSMKACLISFQMKRHKGLIQSSASYSLDLLETRLTNTEPIKPCHSFALNYQALCGSYELLLTFAIVLMQFNISST